MVSKIIARIAITGLTIFGRAFLKAYKETVAANGAGASKLTDAKSQQTGISLQESLQILDMRKETPVTEMVKKYKTMYEANDPKQGGSLYLQSKIFRARERVEMDVGEWPEAKEIEGK